MTVKSILAISLLLIIGTGEDYSSPMASAIDAEGERIYVAEHTANRIAVLDGVTLKRVREIDLPGRPTGLALSDDGARLYATVGGKVLVIDTEMCATLNGTASGNGACAPVTDPDGITLYVCDRFDDSVSVINIAAGEEKARIPVVREPVAAAITPDGKTLLVANHLPAGPADGDYAGAVVSAIELPEGEASSIALPNGSTGLRGICVSPDGRHAFVTHILARYHLPTTQLERGWMNTNALSIIDVEAGTLLNTVLLDDVDLGAANPWDVVCTGEYIVVSHAGTHELSVIDRAALLDKLAALDETEASAVPDDLAFLVDIRRRIPLEGNGPRGIAAAGNTVYVAEYFSDSVGVVEIGGDSAKAKSVALGPDRTLTKERRGEMLFNDGTICFQQWQSCASCHPDGRADGLNWDLLNDGFGNPKNTKSLLLSHATPPSMVMGVRDTAEAAVRAGLRHILFCVRPEEDAEAIDAYLEAMAPDPSPRLVDGGLSEAAQRGSKVFAKAGCMACHPTPHYSDLNSYDLGSLSGRDEGRALDTPALVEVWRTAPYLYDGRAESIEAMLRKHNEADRHGLTSELSEKEMADLIEFVLSL